MILVIVVVMLCCVDAQSPRDKALALLAKMTTQEKLTMVHG